MVNLELTQETFDKFVDALNHRMTRVENSVRKINIDISWMKRIIGWQTALITGILISVFSIAIKYFMS